MQMFFILHMLCLLPRGQTVGKECCVVVVIRGMNEVRSYCFFFFINLRGNKGADCFPLYCFQMEYESSCWYSYELMLNFICCMGVSHITILLWLLPRGQSKRKKHSLGYELYKVPMLAFLLLIYTATKESVISLLSN